MARPADRVPGYGRRRRSRTVAGVVRAGAALPRRGHMRAGVERGGSAAARGDVGNLAMCPARPCSRPACGARPGVLDDRMMRHVATLMVLLFAAPAAHAEVRATLPLGGYYRPGMCMPVRVEGTTTPETGSVELTADGALASRLRVSEGEINAVLPFLAAREIEEMRVNGVKVDAKLRALPSGVRLIGTTIPATRPSTASTAESIVVPLDPLDPVPGPAMAWEAMDELIVDAAGAARLGEQKLLGLLTFGIAIVVP